mgnify:CR=1 FL=1
MIKNELINVEAVLDLMLDAVCVVDKQGTFVFVSAAIIGTSVSRFVTLAGAVE